MAAIVQTLTRLPLPDLGSEAARAAAPPAPAAAPAADASGDDGPPPPLFRLDLPIGTMPERDWTFDEPPPRRLPHPDDDALVAEADFSVLGLFRLETRPAPGGFAVVVRHAAPLGASGLEDLGDAVAAEAERYGVRARVRFSFDPTLRPTN